MLRHILLCIFISPMRLNIKMKQHDRPPDDSDLSDAMRRLQTCQTLINRRCSSTIKLRSNIQPTVCLMLMYVKKQEMGGMFGSMVYKMDEWYEDEEEAMHQVTRFRLSFVATRTMSLHQLITQYPVDTAKILKRRAKEYLQFISSAGHHLLTWVYGFPPVISEEQCNNVILACQSFLDIRMAIDMDAKLEDPLNLMDTGRLVAMLMSNEQKYCASKIAALLQIRNFVYHGKGEEEGIENLLHEYNSWRWLMEIRGIGKKKARNYHDNDRC